LVDLAEYGFKEEELEEGKDQYVKTGWPEPCHFPYRLVVESFKQSIEEHYYWILNYLRYDWGYSEIDKITDVFAASEHSAFFGVAQQRIGLQQDKVVQFLATIGKMVKDLFQIVREIRIIKERLSYYHDSYTTSPSSESAEITLKGTYIDMVEGGAKNPASVYGMARELQFTTLPDLFFSIHPKSSKEIDEVVDKLDFNRKVKEVLKRKLRTFLAWKEHTFDELKNRERFTLKYLRQHFDVIKMYMTWVRPYLRNIRRLQSEAMEEGKPFTPDLVSAFEGSLVEIEFLAKYMPQGNKEYYAVDLIHFRYRTRPSLSYQQEGYQRGPIHVGESRITIRPYAWNNKEIENYKKMRDQEDFELLGLIDASVKAAMESLGDELEKYLTEAGEKSLIKKEKSKEKKKNTLFEPFLAIGKGFGELFGIEKKQTKPKKVDKFKLEKEQENAKKYAVYTAWETYKNFKKAHKMLAW
jgi:hypothetical protein